MNDLVPIDEPIEGEFSTDACDIADAAYEELLTKLNVAFPPVSGKGFDFSRIQGSVGGKTAKAVVLHLSCLGWSIADIADSIEVPASVVSKYLMEVIQEASPIDDVEALRRFELRKLDMQEKKCWELFEKSCEDEVTETEGESEKGGFTKKQRKGQSGNPAYMRVLLEISKRRASLIGLDKPTKVQVDKTEQKLQVTEVIVRTREEALAARAAGLMK